MAKIDVISGFLGAGKTTLIKKLLKEAFRGEKVVLIENEFGEIGIDGGFLQEAGVQITEMNSGCICCSLVGDFGKALKQVEETYHPDRIIIEPSGVGKLSDVMGAILKAAEDCDIHLNSATTVCDAKKCKMYMKNFGEFYDNQVENAGAIVLSRTQMTTDEKLAECVALLQEKNPKARILTTSWDEISGETILAAMENSKDLMEGLLEEAKAIAEEHAHHHHHHHDDGEECECHEHHHHDDDDEDEEHECCHHHHHDDDDEECECHEHHHHHHDDDEECECHEHHHHHDDDEECECHEHHHHHDDDEECECHEHHHHDDDEECECHEHHHHHHDDDDDDEEECSCGCGHHHHHHDHDADEVFTSWGKETPKKFEESELTAILEKLEDSSEFGIILRSKGIVPLTDGTWAHFDLVPGEHELRRGAADYTGRLCVIGSQLNEEKLAELFGI